MVNCRLHCKPSFLMATHDFRTFSYRGPSSIAFSATFLVNARTEKDATTWIQNLEEHTTTTFRITRTYCVKGSRILYKTDRHCQHKRKKPTSKTMARSTKPKRSLQRNKKTGCPTGLTLRVHSRNVSSSSLYGSHPCEVALTWDHNHSITSAHAISFRPIATETREQFYTYFEQGHSLSSSIHHHSFNIAIKYEGRELQYQTALADRSINPLPKDIYYLYHKWRSEKHGKENGETMFNQLTKIIEEYNKEHAQIGGRAFFQQYEHKPTDNPQKKAASQPLVLAVCTPLMSRAHQLVKQAGELVYCDSTSSLDRYNCPIAATKPQICGLYMMQVVVHAAHFTILSL